MHRRRKSFKKHCKNKAQYKVRASVLLQNCKKLSRKGSKLEPNWTGPYIINEVLSKGTFRLRDSKNPSKLLAQKYNMARLKLYYHCNEDKRQSRHIMN